MKTKNKENIYEGLEFIDITSIPIKLEDWKKYKPDHKFDKKISGVTAFNLHAKINSRKEILK